MDWTVIIGPLAGIITAIVTIAVDRWLQRKKTRAETYQLDANTRMAIDRFWEERSRKIELEYLELESKHDRLREEHNALCRDLERTKDRVAALAREMSFVKRVMAKMWAGINVLLHQLSDAGLTPAWIPDKEITAYCTTLLSDTSCEPSELN
jgi:hypothetical protein